MFLEGHIETTHFKDFCALLVSTPHCIKRSAVQVYEREKHSFYSTNVFTQNTYFRLSGISRDRGWIWGCERAYARSHPQIRVSTTEIPKQPYFLARYAKYSATDPATAALSDSICPFIGSFIRMSQDLTVNGRIPSPSEPTTSPIAPSRRTFSGLCGLLASFRLLPIRKDSICPAVSSGYHRI
jgi:hypothetical protein